MNELSDEEYFITQKIYKQIYISIMAQIFIKIDKEFYFAGETVYGEVFLQLYENMNANEVLIKFKGWETVRWIQEQVIYDEEERNRVQAGMIWGGGNLHVKMDSTDSSSSNGEQQSMKYHYIRQGDTLKKINRYSGGRLIIKSNNVLHNFGGQFIPAGQYVFPFSFKTAENYPASFCDRGSDKSRKGRIKYQMRVFVRGFNGRRRLIKHKTQIVIRQTSQIKQAKQQMEAHVKSCCCIDQGVSKICCYFDKDGYSPGQQAKIYCILDNKLSQANITQVTVKLINDIRYSSAENHQKTFTHTLFTQRFPGLPAGQEIQRDKTVNILNQTQQKDKRDIMPTARGQRLSSTYHLRVQAELDASCTCCSDLPIVNQHIVIYPYIPVDYFFKAPPNWDPTTMPIVNLEQAIAVNNSNLANMNNPYY